MKKIKSMLVITTMMLVGGLVNVGASSNIHSFYSTANSMSWNAIATRAKITNDRYFGAIPDKIGAADVLIFKVTPSDNYGLEICRTKVTEGTPAGNWCAYGSAFRSDSGMKVTAHVISDTFSLTNFPISGVLDYY